MLEGARSSYNLDDWERDPQEQLEHYQSRLQRLESSGEDLEQRYIKLLDDKKQQVNDLRQHVEALEKQVRAEKQFVEVGA